MQNHPTGFNNFAAKCKVTTSPNTTKQWRLPTGQAKKGRLRQNIREHEPVKSDFDDFVRIHAGLRHGSRQKIRLQVCRKIVARRRNTIFSGRLFGRHFR